MSDEEYKFVWRVVLLVMSACTMATLAGLYAAIRSLTRDRSVVELRNKRSHLRRVYGLVSDVAGIAEVAARATWWNTKRGLVIGFGDVPARMRVRR